MVIVMCVCVCVCVCVALGEQSLSQVNQLWQTAGDITDLSLSLSVSLSPPPSLFD